jgi:putative heme iron utilization protein
MSTADSDLTQSEQKEISSASTNAHRLGDPAGDVRRWLLETKSATLCTLAAKPQLEGYPFGSIVPFTVDAQGRPVIMIADIAAHTANLRRDSKASLFISDPHAQGDPQSSWRAGIVGSMRRIMTEDKESRHRSTSTFVSHTEYQDIHSRYVERVPNADNYSKQHDFDYWRMEEIQTVRYIAGFGRICWIEGNQLLRDPLQGGLDQAAEGAVTHMNEDHQQNLIEMCEGLYGFTPASARMISLDTTGFKVEVSEPNRTLFFSFGREIDAESLRKAVIQVLQRARTVEHQAEK